MLKLLVLGVLLWQEVVKNVSGQTHAGAVDTKPPGFPAIIPLTKNESSEGLALETDGKYNFHASQQIFYLQGPFAWKRSTDLASNLHDVSKEIGVDYIVTNGIGAHKLHMRKLSWNRARNVCVDEGGHLAIIRTESEAKIILQMMHEDSINDAWLGYHDQFEEADWISVLDEPLGQTGWARWAKSPSNPDNLDKSQNCACLWKSNGGMGDEKCYLAKSFVCKITNF